MRGRIVLALTGLGLLPQSALAHNGVHHPHVEATAATAMSIAHSIDLFIVAGGIVVFAVLVIRAERKRAVLHS